ncbi:hypothetical protein ACOMHN_047842 [Nucella lapillus]
MPSFTDTSSGYVQWQSARRQAKQLAQDAAIDIIEHYNRVVLNGNPRDRRRSGADVADNDPEECSPGLSKKLTPRSQSKKTTTLRTESVDRKGGVFTEGISSFSRQNPFPLSLKRSDILSDNQPDTVKLAREKSRIYLALSHPGPRQNPGNKGDQSAKSVRTLPPPSASSYPWGDMLSVTEIARAKTFTMDERTGLLTRSSLDSRQTASDVHPATERRTSGKYMSHLPMFYPSITGAPPNTPLQMAPPYRPKAPSINIVSLDGETVSDSGKKSESRSRLPVLFRSMVTVSGPVTGSDSRATSRPGIDLPHLPLRYAESNDPSFTPRDRPARINYFMHSKARRRQGGVHLKNNKIRSVTIADQENGEAADNKTSVTDPYANRFQLTSSVTSLGKVQVFPPGRSGADPRSGDDGGLECKDGMVRKPTIMLTVEEEEEGGENGSHPTGRSPPEEGPPQPHPLPTLEVTPPAGLGQQVKGRSQSMVSNNSMSVPLNVKDLSEARPPNELPAAVDEAGSVTLAIPVLVEEADHMDINSDPFPDPGQESGDHPATSPDIVSVLDTARTVATQTSLPYDPDAPKNRPILKIKTLSMFPDISGGADVGGDRPGSQAGRSVTREPLLRMTHGDSTMEGRLAGLPELKELGSVDRPQTEDGAGLTRKSSGVRNMTFISPLEGQQKAKRF